jgi:hypothetical protein
MNFNELKNELLTRDVYDIVKELILGNEPICFNGDKEKVKLLLESISTGLDLNPKCIEIVGSAKLGFSLNPFRLGQAFSDKSDIDVLVVSNDIFDTAWKDLLKLDFSYHKLKVKDRDFLNECYETIHRGYVSPDKLPIISDFRKFWWGVFDKISNQRVFEYRKIRGRLFKSWDFAEKYYSIQLVNLKKERKDEN